MISRGTWVVWYILGVGSSSFIGDFSNISIITISSVGNMLCATIRKSNRVRTNSISITSTGLSSIEGSLGVVVSYGIFKSVGLSWTIIGGFMVGRGRFVVRWGGSMVDYRSGMDHGGMVGRSMDHRGMVGGSMVDQRSGMVGRGVVNSMVNWGMDWGVDRMITTNIGRSVGGGDGSGSNHSSGVFFRVVIAMNSLGSSMGLASHCSGIGTMGLVD